MKKKGHPKILAFFFKMNGLDKSFNMKGYFEKVDDV
jgi:hypothetical protein